VEKLFAGHVGAFGHCPRGAGLQAASAPDRHWPNKHSVGVRTMKRRKRRAPAHLQSGVVSECTLAMLSLRNDVDSGAGVEAQVEACHSNAGARCPSD
jgi:hypothetical protein